MFIRFGEIARSRLNQQSQYASRYIDGRNGYPNLGEGLRFQGESHDYHSVEIHKDDVDKFVNRVFNFRGDARDDSGKLGKV